MSDSRHKRHPQRIVGRDPDLPSLLGDALCLDFANSVDDRTGDNRTETLFCYADLVRWAWHAQLIDDQQRDELNAIGDAHPERAAGVFDQAISLREAIYRVFATIAAEQVPDQHDLGLLHRYYLDALGHAAIVPGEDLHRWTWSVQADSRQPEPEAVLWPIARSAVDLLLSEQLDRVKQCPGCDDCGWLFLDTSKNGTRRWCSMEGCGSRAKMRRLYARRKSR